MRRTVSFLVFALTSLSMTASIFGQTPIAADWNAGGLTGTLNGATVTLTGANDTSLFSSDLSGADFSAVPLATTQECVSYDANSNWKATFSQPQNDIYVHAVFWRGSFGGPNPVIYGFDKPFTIVSGLSSATVSGNSLQLPNTGFHNGIMKFSGPLASLSCTSNASCCSNQAFTLSAGTCPIVSYGSQCAGTGGFAPKLTAVNCATAGSSLTLALNDGLGGAPALMFFGANQAALNMGYGCTLNVTPILPAIINFPLGGVGPGNGSINLVGAIPAAASGVTFTTQVFVVDGGVPAGFSNSKGLQITIQ